MVSVWVVERLIKRCELFGEAQSMGLAHFKVSRDYWNAKRITMQWKLIHTKLAVKQVFFCGGWGLIPPADLRVGGRHLCRDWLCMTCARNEQDVNIQSNMMCWWVWHSRSASTMVQTPDSNVMPDNGAVTQRQNWGGRCRRLCAGVLLDEFLRYTRRAMVTWHVRRSWKIFSRQSPHRLGPNLFELWNCDGSLKFLEVTLRGPGTCSDSESKARSTPATGGRWMLMDDRWCK